MLAILALVGAVQAAAPNPPEKSAALLNEYVDRVAVHGFSGSILVEQDGRVLIRRGVGLANREAAIPVTPTTPFYVASISKQFTAAAILRLESEGRLHTTDSISRYFPAVPADKAGITIHQLLSHTSGLRRVPGAPRSEDELVGAAMATPLGSAPGAEYFYSNLGYNLLALIVERVTGMPFARYMTDHVFGPAGLRGTWIVTSPPRPLPRTRVYRGGTDMGDLLISHNGPPGPGDVGSVGVVTTLDDLYRWERALRAGTVLSPQQRARWWSEQSDGYGYGWAVGTTARGTAVVQHDGQLFPEGWNAEYRRYPDEGVVILVLSNTYAGGASSERVAVDLARLLFGGELTMPPAARETSASDRTALSGRYELAGGGALVVASRRDGLWLRAEGQRAVNLLRFGTLADTADFADLAPLTSRLITALAARDLAPVAALLGSSRTPAQWLSQLRPLFDSLEGRHGPYAGHTMLFSSADSSAGSDVTTFVRVTFGRTPVTLRYYWRSGTLIGAADFGSFPPGVTSVEVVPGPMPLIWETGGWLGVWDIVAQRGRRLRPVRDGTGEITGLELLLQDGRVIARKVKAPFGQPSPGQ